VPGLFLFGERRQSEAATAFWVGWGKSGVALRLPPTPKSAWPSDEKALATLGQSGSFRVHQFLK